MRTMHRRTVYNRRRSLLAPVTIVRLRHATVRNTPQRSTQTGVLQSLLQVEDSPASIPQRKPQEQGPMLHQGDANVILD